MRWIIQELANISLAKLWKVISNPRIVLAILKAPPALSDVDAVISLFPYLTTESVEACRLEFLGNATFFEEINGKMLKKRNRQARLIEWYEFLYMVVRFSRAEIVFETGVFDGQASAVILQALNDNGNGVLISIDLPAQNAIEGSTNLMTESDLPPNCKPGWVVPDYLRQRHQLLIGDSKDLLPQLFEQYKMVDIFLHDSLHTFQHQQFEYTIAWPHLRDEGILLSDDIFWSHAFHKFCKEKDREYVNLGRFGAVSKKAQTETQIP